MTLGRLLSLTLALPLAAGTASPGPVPSAREPETVRIEVASRAPLRVLLRHLPPAGTGGAAHAPVLIVHGASFPSALAAAYRLRGESWMDDLAAHGFDAWALDFLGYGGSDRYPEMAGPPNAHAPLGRAPEAAAQIEAAVRYIVQHTGAPRVALIAHSWGTLPAGRFAAEHGDLVERLVLFGPVVDRHAERPRDSTGAPLPAYADVTRQDQRENFDLGVPAGVAPPFTDADFAPWADLYFAAGQGGSVRVPFGPLADARDADAGILPYSPAAIRVPTLLVRGSWDAVSTAADLDSLFDRLGAHLRRAVTFGGGTHRMHLEPSRAQLFREVDAFLAGGDEETR